MGIKPSELATALIECIESITLPSGAKVTDADVFRGTIGPPPLEAQDRMFGVELGVSQRSYMTSCVTDHRLDAVISFTYVLASDNSTHIRVIDDMARVADALRGIRTNASVTNADSIDQIVLQDGLGVIVDQNETTAEINLVATIDYQYQDS